MARHIVFEGKRERPGRCDICGESDRWYYREATPDVPYSVICACMYLDPPPCSKCTAVAAARDGLCEGCATE